MTDERWAVEAVRGGTARRCVSCELCGVLLCVCLYVCVCVSDRAGAERAGNTRTCVKLRCDGVRLVV